MIFTLPNTKENRDYLDSLGFTIFSDLTLDFEYLCPDFSSMYYSGDRGDSKDTQYGELTQDIIPDLMMLPNNDIRVLYLQSIHHFKEE